MKINNHPLGIPFTFEDLFGESPPKNRLDLVKEYKKSDLLIVLSLINNYPERNLIYNHYSSQTELKILEHLFSGFVKEKIEIIKRLSELLKSQKFQGKRGFLFGRIPNIFAIDEVLSYSSFGNAKLHPTSVFKYLLSVNSFLLECQNEAFKEDIKFLDLYPVLATQQAESAPNYSRLELFRSFYLVKFLLLESQFLRKYAQEYFDKLGWKANQYFVLVYAHIVPALNNMNPMQIPIYKPKSPLELRILKSLIGENIGNTKNFDFLNLKSNPIYEINKEEFLLLDLPFLINRLFYHMINELWFDIIKPKLPIKGLNHKTYFAEIGKFYEVYIAKLLKQAFPFLKHPEPKFLDELKVIKPGHNSEIELCDIFLRQNKNILVGEIKSTNYGSKFKFADDLLNSFAENIDRFLKDFGILQISNTIKTLLENPTLFDVKIDANKKYEVFPIIVVHEKMLQLPFTNSLFQEQFLQQLKKIGINFLVGQSPNKPVSIEKMIIHPVTVIHTTDVELLTYLIQKKEVKIWRFLKNYHRKSLLMYGINSEVLKLNIDYSNRCLMEDARNVLQILEDKNV